MGALQSFIRVRTTLLSAICLLALQVLGEEKAPVLPTVTSFVCPKYPDKAESLALQGMVRLQVTTDGHAVSDVKLISGHPLLAPSAVKNVRSWAFADHAPTTFIVDYFYVFQGRLKRDPVTKCDARLELPSRVTVSREMPPRL